MQNRWKEWSSSTVTDILEPILYIRYVHSLTWLKKRSNMSVIQGVTTYVSLSMLC